MSSSRDWNVECSYSYAQFKAVEEGLLQCLKDIDRYDSVEVSTDIKFRHPINFLPKRFLNAITYDNGISTIPARLIPELAEHFTQLFPKDCPVGLVAETKFYQYLKFLSQDLKLETDWQSHNHVMHIQT